MKNNNYFNAQIEVTAREYAARLADAICWKDDIFTYEDAFGSHVRGILQGDYVFYGWYDEGNNDPYKPDRAWCYRRTDI